METGCLAEMRDRKALKEAQRAEVRANQGKWACLERFLA
jgi:hypothetical protein